METIQNFPEITKKDFPLLNKNLKSNEQIIYLDHAATTQKPIQVLKKIDEYGFNGDYIESQAFAYLAVRSYLNFPISFPNTTKCSEPTVGGEINKNF